MAVATMRDSLKLGGAGGGGGGRWSGGGDGVPETETPLPPGPMQVGHIRLAATASQQRTRAAGRLAAHQSPAQRLHPIPTPGKSHCRTLACDHAEIQARLRLPRLHRGLLP